jgi:hypothetical protein
MKTALTMASVIEMFTGAEVWGRLSSGRISNV